MGTFSSPQASWEETNCHTVFNTLRVSWETSFQDTLTAPCHTSPRRISKTIASYIKITISAANGRSAIKRRLQSYPNVTWMAIDTNMMTPKQDDCIECVCNEGFKNAMDIYQNPNCKTRDCAIEFWYLNKIRQGCAPIYYGSNKCCPSSTKCRKWNILDNREMR